jgi:hypothetical protein
MIVPAEIGGCKVNLMGDTQKMIYIDIPRKTTLSNAWLCLGLFTLIYVILCAPC